MHKALIIACAVGPCRTTRWRFRVMHMFLLTKSALLVIALTSAFSRLTSTHLRRDTLMTLYKYGGSSSQSKQITSGPTEFEILQASHRYASSNFDMSISTDVAYRIGSFEERRRTKRHCLGTRKLPRSTIPICTGSLRYAT